MTTIAYKAGMMACDSAWSDIGEVLTRRPKIIRLPSGGLLGEAGACDTRDIISLVGNVKTPGGLPERRRLVELRLDYSGILVLPSGRIFHVYADEPDAPGGDWDCGIYEVGEPFYAVGSGRSYAFAIMENGGDAKRAVEIACRRDNNSRPPVHVAYLPSSLKKKNELRKTKGR
jgi:hypothetical protein